MKKGNEGFSLVELIIVIAIMAVLIGLMAPQYLRFVARSKVTSDVQNATEIADAINAAVSEQSGFQIASQITGKGGTEVSNVPGLPKLPNCKVDKDLAWDITVSEENGVTQIKLGTYIIYPSANGTNGFYTHYYH